MSSTTRKPVLFLRSFNEEFAEVPYERKRYEECFAEVFALIGPLVAVGRPNEKLPTPGAARFYLYDQDWQRGVQHLLDRAQAVVLQVGSSSGLAWEIETALRQVKPEKLLLYFPLAGKTVEWGILDQMFSEWPKLSNLLSRNQTLWRLLGKPDTHASMHARKQAHWEQFLARYGYLIPASLPAHLGEAIFVCFDPNWNPKLLELSSMSKVGRDKDDTAFRVRESLRPFLGGFETEPVGAALRRTWFWPAVLLCSGMPLLVGGAFFHEWLKKALKGTLPFW